MADTAESSSVPSKNEKPVIVRVKRKPHQSPLEAFWLEINERPLKRPLLDLENLSLSESSRKVDEVKTTKLLVRHVETVSRSEVSLDILQSFVTNSTSSLDSKAKIEERRQAFKTENYQQKHDQLLVKAKQEQENLSRNARFEQIWRSRKGRKDAMHDEALREMCHLYDVVRVDTGSTSLSNNEAQKQKSRDEDLEDQRLMASYLPLLREFIPSAVEEIESDINAYVSERASVDGYVYDLYAVKDADDIDTTSQDVSNPFPLVQVDDDDNFYDGPDESEYETDDSNAEDNPLNDYPDEESSEEEETDASDDDDDDDESEEDDSASDRSENIVGVNLSENEDVLLEEDEIYGDDDYSDDDNIVDCDGGDDDDWRWSYR